jgi:hypothetical protein
MLSLISSIKKREKINMNLLSTQNRIDLEEALDILNCSESELLKLIHCRKIKAQKVGERWLLNPSDCYKFKESQSEARYFQNLNVLNEKPQNHFRLHTKKNAMFERLDPSEIEVRIKIPTEKYEIINLALNQATNKKSLFQVLNEKIDEAYAKLSDIDLEI